MKIAVLGLGKIGHNTAALLVKRGFEVSGFTRDEKKPARLMSMELLYLVLLKVILK